MKYLRYKGFTLAEVLVSVTIMSLLMSVVFFGYSEFNDSLALSAAAQEMTLAIREAQTYGLTVKEVTIGSGQFDYAYGVSFNVVSDPSNYYIFVDSNNNLRYDPGTGCGGVTTECVKRMSLRNGIVLSAICNQTVCNPLPGQNRMSVTYLRPNPDARIYFSNNLGITASGPYTGGRINLRSPRGKVSNIVINKSGQISIQ